MSAGRDAAIQFTKDQIKTEKVAQEQAQAQKMLFDAKRENVKLQLEAAYREQLVNVYTEVSLLFIGWCTVFVHDFNSDLYSIIIRPSVV